MLTFASFLFLAAISFTDIRRKKIPNFIVTLTSILAIFIHVYTDKIDGLFFSVLGFTLGFIVLLIPFFLSGTGAGDVKAFAALGALIGPSAIFQTFLYTALIGGVIAVGYYVVVYDIRAKARAGMLALGAFAASRDPRCLLPETPKKKHKFPYAPAIALGYLAYLAWGNIV
ncbi:MAG: prepilin peptidase [Desulfuromonadales bacterium]|nr:prepilin peptidase [Desulfuromonadales bacterium]